MTETSMLWATSTTGDGAISGYSEDNTTGLFHRTLINDLTTEGSLKNYLNELEVTATNDPVSPKTTVDTGAAWIYGFHYWNTAAVDLPLTLPVVGDTGFRVVLRASYGSTRTVRVALLQNTDGVSAIPAVTQSVGTTWEISLASGVVDTSGDIWKTSAKSVAGVTDVREFVHPNIEVEPAMIANRTRTIWVPATIGWNITDSTVIVESVDPTGQFRQAIQLPDNKLAEAFGSFAVPNDFLSDMSIKAVVGKAGGASTTQAYSSAKVIYGACGEDIGQHLESSGTYTQSALVNTNRNCVDEFSITLAAVGDMMIAQWERDALDALDTVNAVVFVLGFLVSYTADS